MALASLRAGQEVDVDSVKNQRFETSPLPKAESYPVMGAWHLLKPMLK